MKHKFFVGASFSNNVTNLEFELPSKHLKEANRLTSSNASNSTNFKPLKYKQVDKGVISISY